MTRYLCRLAIITAVAAVIVPIGSAMAAETAAAGAASCAVLPSAKAAEPWDLTTPYRKNETVVHNGTSFIATYDNFMEEPGGHSSCWKEVPQKKQNPKGDEVSFLLASR